MKAPTDNLFIICTKTGKTLAKFQWQNSAKDAIKSIRFSHDNRHVVRLVNAAKSKETNSIEVYRDGAFTEPCITLSSKFEHRNAKSIKKGTPGEIIDTHFAGFDLCCLNPVLQPEQSPFYLFAWSTAEVMTTQDDVGVVYSFDLNS